MYYVIFNQSIHKSVPYLLQISFTCSIALLVLVPFEELLEQLLLFALPLLSSCMVHGL